MEPVSHRLWRGLSGFKAPEAGSNEQINLVLLSVVYLFIFTFKISAYKINT